MVFAADTLALLYFFATEIVIDKMYLQKNKQVQPTARGKKQCHKKSGGELLKHNVAL
jgi:hypothetical protein